MLKANKLKKRRSRTDDKKWLAVEVGDISEETADAASRSNTMSINYGGFRVDVTGETDPGQIFSILRMIKEL